MNRVYSRLSAAGASEIPKISLSDINDVICGQAKGKTAGINKEPFITSIVACICAFIYVCCLICAFYMAD